MWWAWGEEAPPGAASGSEVARVARILCGSGRGVLASGGGGPTGRVGCVLVVRDGRVS